MIGYLVRRLADVPAGDHWLTPAERRWFSDRRSAKRVADWRLGRWTAKAAIAAWLEHRDRPPAVGLEVLAAEDGAPEAFADGRPLALVLSLSHSHGRALAAVADAGTVLGCDLERIEPRSRAFVDSYFTTAERAAVAAAGPHGRDLIATLVWSGKESALKALRQGLRTDTRSLEVTVAAPASDGWDELRIAPVDGGAPLAGRWRRLAGFVLTIAGRPAPDEIVDLA